jgi:hypothetical protein
MQKEGVKVSDFDTTFCHTSPLFYLPGGMTYYE